MDRRVHPAPGDAHAMILALSPYHLTTRETPALAALLLADQVVTLMPVPTEGESREDIELALRRTPAYERLLQSWRWAATLGRAGILHTLWNHDDARADAHAANERFTRSDRWRAMRPFLHLNLFTDADRQLETLCTDLLKAGPDPGVSIPLVAGLDALAVRHHLIAVRAGTPADSARASSRGSVAQRAESRLGQSLVSVALPVLVQASAQQILDARELLEPELTALRAALMHATAEPSPQSTAKAREAALNYTNAFNAQRHLILATEPGAPRVLDATVTLALRRLPANAAIDSSLAALRHVTGTKFEIAPAPATSESLVTMLITQLDATPL